MDDIPKPAKKGSGWVDMSCQMVMQYRELALICRELGQPEKAAKFEGEAKAIGERINEWCWNRTTVFPMTSWPMAPGSRRDRLWLLADDRRYCHTGAGPPHGGSSEGRERF